MKFKIALYWFTGLFTVSIMSSCKGVDKPVPVSVIFDTDIAPDYDDVGALAMLHALADNGEAKILAVISSNAYQTTVPAISVINDYFQRPGIPIGVVKGASPSYNCPRKWAESIIAKYPHKVRSNEAAMDAITLYRKILALAPDTSVTVITVGFFTNLANLLASPADEYSTLNGFELVKKKVKRLVSMAGKVDSSSKGGYEANIMADIPASQKVFAQWPTPITLSGHEIGVEIYTGIKLINNVAIQNSPVKDAYRVSLSYDGNKEGHYSWDQTAVLVAVRGITPYFGFRKIDLRVKDDGKDSVLAGNRINYLVAKQRPEEVAKTIEELMMHVPMKK